MSSPVDAAATARAAFLQACELDVAVRKPGNVSRGSAGHGMDAQLFLASAQAASAGLFEAGRGVGERVEAAVAATLSAAGCNTNLGIVLLCAPIALAAERTPQPFSRGRLRWAIERVLQGLSVDDARAAYRAIAQASPGGLGTVRAEDVRRAPSLDLRSAMALAADRDRIAFQYANGFADLFDTGLAAVPGGAVAPGQRLAAGTVQRVYLAFLARWPDSHIVRKLGAAVAHTVMNSASAWLARARKGEELDADPAFAAWDESLKTAGINPGTSADMTVATLLLALLGAGCAERETR